MRKSIVKRRCLAAKQPVICVDLFISSTPFTDQHRVAQSNVRDLIWKYYRTLKAYRRRPTKRGKALLQARFERIFTGKTGFVTLDRLLARLHKKKSELLVVLDRPEIPLHTNGSENDICANSERPLTIKAKAALLRVLQELRQGRIPAATQEEPGMFDFYHGTPGFLKVHRYDDQKQLIADLGERVILPAEISFGTRNASKRTSTWRAAAGAQREEAEHEPEAGASR
jgi:hypothetical protein